MSFLQFASNFSEAIILILGVALLGGVQYLLNKRQTKEIGSNHISHIESKLDTLLSKIDAIIEYLVRIDERLRK